MTKVPTPRLRPPQNEALCVRQLAVLTRLPVSVRVLRHHRDIRPGIPRIKTSEQVIAELEAIRTSREWTSFSSLTTT